MPLSAFPDAVVFRVNCQASLKLLAIRKFDRTYDFTRFIYIFFKAVLTVTPDAYDRQ